VQYGGIFFFSVEVAPQDGVFSIFVAFFYHKYGVFFLTPMKYGVKQFVAYAVWGNFPFSNIIVL
jgi:hypothetical protein